MRTTSFTLAATAAVLVAGALVAPAAAVAGPLAGPVAQDKAAGGAYTALPSSRILDTRDGTGGPQSPLAFRTTRTLQVAGVGGVPASGASSVVLNVTAVSPTTAGFLSVFPVGRYPAGTSPTTSNLNFAAGQNIANLVVVPLSSTGAVSLYAEGPSGGVDVVADVQGWYAAGSPVADGAFAPVGPNRVFDSRTTTQIVPGNDRSVPIAGVANSGVPANAGAVIVNVTVADTSAAGYVTVYPGGMRPTASNLNYAAGQTVPNLVAVPLSDSGSITLALGGTTAPADLLVDVFGYYVGSAPSVNGMFGALTPSRILDTRFAIGAPTARVAGGATLPLQVLGQGGVPTSGVSAVVVNVTAVGPATAGYLTVFSGPTKPTASNLNFPPGVNVPNLVIVPVTNGSISIFNGGSGPVDLVADVTGYVRSGSLSVPSASVSRYVTDLSATQSNTQLAATMNADAQADAKASTGSSPRLAILEFGAQTNKAGSGSSTGVRLPTTNTRLTYPQVQAAAQGYLDGYEAAAPSATLTVAVGTSSAGYLGATYLAGDKGTDWAALVTAVAAYSKQKGYGITVVGANDIEANFSATDDEVRAWIAAYRAGSNPPALVNNGAAAGCPSTLGAVNQSCGAVYVDESDPNDPVYNTWSQSDYVSFSTGTGITIAPQIYYAYQANSWENILLSSGGNAIRFSGVLTQVAACQERGPCDSLTPTQAWAAMNQALDSTSATASVTVPAVTDIRYP